MGLTSQQHYDELEEHFELYKEDHVLQNGSRVDSIFDPGDIVNFKYNNYRNRNVDDTQVKNNLANNKLEVMKTIKKIN